MGDCLLSPKKGLTQWTESNKGPPRGRLGSSVDCLRSVQWKLRLVSSVELNRSRLATQRQLACPMDRAVGRGLHSGQWEWWAIWGIIPGIEFQYRTSANLQRDTKWAIPGHSIEEDVITPILSPILSTVLSPILLTAFSTILLAALTDNLDGTLYSDRTLADTLDSTLDNTLDSTYSRVSTGISTKNLDTTLAGTLDGTLESRQYSWQ
ncbi:hypothetical protein N7540_004311 [Penicillium herquei]|nr:hypothetical protein N7540_004311 [Penicillium herquei]